MARRRPHRSWLPLAAAALAAGYCLCARQPVAWVPAPASAGRAVAEVAPAEAAPEAGGLPQASQRREVLLAGLFSQFAAVAGAPLAARAETPSRVAVLGGSGFVGRRICEQLAAAGVEVVSLSRSGGPPAGAGAWASKVQWMKGDVLAAGGSELAAAVAGADVVVSSIGAIGSGDDARGNGATNEAAVAAAASAKAKRFVLVSASSQVAQSGLDAIFGGYIEGKRRAEGAVAAQFPDASLVLQPTFIYGGEEFSATPPRVSGWYGAKVEGLLDSGFFRGLAGATPGFIKLALSPPNSAEEVAAAAVAGALGQATGTLGDHDAIKAAAAKR